MMEHTSDVKSTTFLETSKLLIESTEQIHKQAILCLKRPIRVSNILLQSSILKHIAEL